MDGIQLALILGGALVLLLSAWVAVGDANEVQAAKVRQLAHDQEQSR